MAAANIYDVEQLGVDELLKNKWFQLGFYEIRGNQPFNDKIYNRMSDGMQQLYEVGRQFGHIYSGQIIQGRGVSHYAKKVLEYAIYDKTII